MTAGPCPPVNELQGFVLGSVADDVQRRVALHVPRCASCELMLQQFEDQADVLLDVLCAAAGREGFLGEPECGQAVERVRSLAGEASLSADTIDRLFQWPLPASGKIRDYVLLEILGEGGMGTVYKAVHTQLQRPVALKVIRPDRTGSARAVERFRREMQAVGRLDHPHIVRATDAGEAEEIHFLVMEYVDGVNLSRLVQRHGPLRVADACEMIRQAAVGLGHAHRRGLVHRDVKPSNLMLTAAADSSTPHAGGGAVVKILDLGLAWLSNDADDMKPMETENAGAASPDADTAAIAGRREATQTTHAVGTLDYMAPEQLARQPSLDHRADIYSLGATLHKLLVGYCPRRRPQTEPSAEVVPSEISAAGTVGYSLQRDDVPRELDQVVSRMLAARVEDRPRDMDEVIAALDPFCAGSGLIALLQGEVDGDRIQTGRNADRRGHRPPSRGPRRGSGSTAGVVRRLPAVLRRVAGHPSAAVAGLVASAVVIVTIAIPASPRGNEAPESVAAVLPPVDPPPREISLVEPRPEKVRQPRPQVDPSPRESLESIADLTEAIRRDPQNLERYLRRSAAYSSVGRLDEAIADCNQGLKIDPGNVDLLYNRATAYAEKGEHDKAIADCGEVIRSNPSYARAYGTRGVAYGGKGEFAKAIADFTELIRHNPMDGQTYYNRSFCYHRLGDHAKAAADLDKSRQLGFQTQMK